MKIRIAMLLGLSLGPLSACADRGAAEKMPDLRLSNYSAQTGASLAACPTPKCMTAYVAPWCGYCRQSTPILLALREYLKAHGVTTRFVVGKDRLTALRAYAREFGPDTLLDTEDAFSVSGVPHFFVSDDKGMILREVSGVPMGAESIEQFAAAFGLP
jgi:thiol-disulfide isomerase/thioredoxin